MKFWKVTLLSGLLLAVVSVLGQERAENPDFKGAELFREARRLETVSDTVSPSDESVLTKANALYLEAANLEYAPAMNFIGFRYYKGEGLQENPDSAIYWIDRAARLGDITAAANLSFLLSEGTGINHDEATALRWSAVAAEGGVTGAAYKMVELAEKLQTPYALALLGEAYSKGMGVEYDHQKSLEYYYRAAEQGDPSASFIVAELLDFFPDNFSAEPAAYWYEKAAEQGVEDSLTAWKLLYSPPSLPEETIEANPQFLNDSDKGSATEIH